MENCKNSVKLHQVGCGSGHVISILEPGFDNICVLTKYRCCNASKWPQMHQKWIITIPVGSGHTLDTLNHGLESLFYCFITHFGAGGSLAPPGAPWSPPGPAGAPLTPGRSSWAIASHPGSKWPYGSYLPHLEWIIQAFFTPQYISLHCSLGTSWVGWRVQLTNVSLFVWIGFISPYFKAPWIQKTSVQVVFQTLDFGTCSDSILQNNASYVPFICPISTLFPTHSAPIQEIPLNSFLEVLYITELVCLSSWLGCCWSQLFFLKEVSQKLNSEDLESQGTCSAGEISSWGNLLQKIPK